MNELTIEENEIAIPSSADEIELVAASQFQPKIEASEALLGDMGSIPDKMAFKIGEAAEMVGVKQYVLR
ncbi:MAG TPA: hypothetical protein VM432_03045, partial [Bdellovibrionales bacterium]|nr:hypothetical protein [Bdellovibrionales bacterium]